MRKLWIIGLLVFLFGCSERDFGMERGLAFRQRLLECNGCSFDAAITAVRETPMAAWPLP